MPSDSSNRAAKLSFSGRFGLRCDCHSNSIDPDSCYGRPRAGDHGERQPTADMRGRGGMNPIRQGDMVEHRAEPPAPARRSGGRRKREGGG